MHFRKRLLSLLLSLVLVLPIMLLLSPAPVVSAQTTSTLYGTGSADEINIVKLLDMALNKGGMSMSPATIKAFLEYWWDSVQADLATCISNADAAIATTQDFVDYVYTALEDTEHYDQLGDIIKRYVQYVAALEGKSLSDIKQLLLQPGTFRQFLLSYVTDQDGNIAGTVDNKIKRYNIGKDFVNMTRKAANVYIEEHEGYWLVPSYTYKDILPTMFSTNNLYTSAYESLKTIPDDFLIYANFNHSSTSSFFNISDQNLILISTNEITPEKNGSLFVSRNFKFYVVDDNWNRCGVSYIHTSLNGEVFDLSDSSVFTLLARNFDSSVCKDICYYSSIPANPVFITSDSRLIRIWKSLDAFKASSVGQSNIYYSSDYSKYDSSVDNSIEFSGSYYNSSSSSYSHDIIQNTIDNSSEVNENTVNNIVNNYITNNNYGDSSGSGSGGSGSGSGSDWWNVGDGIASFVEGIAKLLDFLLKLLGDLIGVISDFLVGLLEIIKSLGAVGSSFGDFLKDFFGFLPDEIIAAIVSGIGLMVVAGVIKAFKK